MLSHTTLDIIFAVIFSLAAIPTGMYFGGLPIKNEELTKRQQSASSIIGLIAMLVVFALIFTHFDIASWAVILTLIIFFAVAKIPAVHQWLIEKWPRTFKQKRIRRK